MQVADSLCDELSIRESNYWTRFEWAEKKFYKDHEIGAVEK